MINPENFDVDKFTLKTENTVLVKKTKAYLNKLWDEKDKNGITHGARFKYLFGLRLYQYAYGKHFDYKSGILPEDKKERENIIYSYRKAKGKSSIARQFQRLSLGYNSLQYELTPHRCNLSSENANNEYGNTTNDHIIGATLIAEYIIYVFRNGLEDKDLFWEDLIWVEERIDTMCNKWLKDNLWLWVTCRITKDEHNPKKKGVTRSREYDDDILKEILYRANLKHYGKANVKVCEYKNIRKEKPIE